MSALRSEKPGVYSGSVTFQEFQQSERVFGGSARKYFEHAREEEWHQHPNGCGWVENTAAVDDTAYVGPEAVVCGTAQVRERARVEDQAWVSCDTMLYGDVVVSGAGHVWGDTRMSHRAVVTDNAEVFSARLSQFAHIGGDAYVSRATISSNVRVYGRARIYAGIYENPAEWPISPILIYGSVGPVYEVAGSLIGGIFFGAQPLEAWLDPTPAFLAEWKEVAAARKYTDAALTEYQQHVRYIVECRSREDTTVTWWKAKNEALGRSRFCTQVIPLKITPKT